MATIVASRYAVLSVDDDEDNRTKKKKIPNKKPDPPKHQNSTSVKTDNSKKKKKQENSQSQVQSKKSQKSNNSGIVKKKKEPTSEQWEEWKQKDAQFIEGSFEEDLSKAILLSKLDYEQNKDLYEAIKKSEEEAKKSSGKKKKNQKIMSLSEFNSLGYESNASGKSTKTEKVREEPEFFDKLDEDIKNEILKEHFTDKRKAKESGNQESLLLVMYKESIEKKDKEIEELKEEIERLNIQLKNVKTRNLKLCQIIGNGEMKDKAEVLMEVERLQTIKDELSSEISSLHIQLEQERSKVRQLTGEQKNKDKGKKHHISNDTQ